VTLAAGSTIGAGLLGFLVVLGLIGASALLFRSMNTQLRKVRTDFPSPPPGTGPDPTRDAPISRPPESADPS